MMTSGSRVGEVIRSFELVKHLGQGGFGAVYQAVVIRPCSFAPVNVGDEVAIKIISKSLLKKKKMYERMMDEEIKIHSKLNHPSILKLYGKFDDEKYVYLILELCSNGDLQRYLKIRSKPFEEDYARHILGQILQGIVYLHSHNIMHRDIKPANLLLDRDFNIKICDFGMAAQLKDNEDKHKTMCGTANYISPEVVKGKAYGLEVDVWGLGVLLYNFVVGQLPFDSGTKEGTLSNILKADLKIPLKCELSSNLKELLELLLCRDQDQRINVHDILNHPFMLDINRWKNQSKISNSRSPDSGLASLGTSSSSNTSNTTNRKVHSEEVPWYGNNKYNSQNGYARSDDNVAFQKSNALPRFGKPPPVRLNANTCMQKAHLMDALKDKIQVLPSLKEGFSEPSEVESPHCAGSCGKEPIGVPPDCHRYKNTECCQQHHLPSHGSRDCEGNFRSYEDAQNGRRCRSASPHNSHCDSGICNRQCKSGNKTCHAESERGCSCEMKIDNNRCHHSVSPVPCAPSSRDNCDSHNRHQQELACSHFGHCLTAHCVHQKSCSCKQESYINHDSCTHDCQQRNKIYHGSNCKNLVLSDGHKTCDAVERDNGHSAHPLSSDISKKPKILNAKYLKPRCNAYKFHRYSILDEGHICVETFDKNEKKHVINVYIISPDGTEITVYKYRRRQKVKLKDIPPSILESGSLPKSFSYEVMPKEHWSMYGRASTYVGYVREITPRILIYSSEAKAILFQSLINYEATFYTGEGRKGGKFVKRLEEIKFIDAVGKTQVVGVNGINLGEDAKRMLAHSLELENKCRMMSDFVEKECGGLFPVFIGSKPARFCTPPKNSSNKENIPLASTTQRSFSHSQQNGVSVMGGHNPLHYGYSLTSQDNFRTNQAPAKTSYSVSNTISQKTPRNIIKRKTEKGCFSFNIQERIFTAEFHDGSEYIHYFGSTFFQFSEQRGQKSRKYKFESSNNPPHIAQKVEDVLAVMKNHFSEFIA